MTTGPAMVLVKILNQQFNEAPIKWPHERVGVSTIEDMVSALGIVFLLVHLGQE